MMRHHHKPPSKRSSTNHDLHKMSTSGTAAQEGSMRPVVHLQPNLIARLMAIDVVPTLPPAPRKPAVGGIVQFQAQPRQTNKCSLQLPYYDSYRGGNDDDAEYSGPTSRLCLNRMMIMGSGNRCRRPQEDELLNKMRQGLQAWQASKAPPMLQTSRPSDYSDGSGRRLRRRTCASRRWPVSFFRFGTDAAGRDSTDQEQRMAAWHKVRVTRRQSIAMRMQQQQLNQLQCLTTAVVVVTSPSHCPRAAQAQESPSHGHTPIVLLKPTATFSESDTRGGVAIGVSQKTVLLGLPKLHRDAGMNLLFQEVKDRVQRELTVLTATTATGRGELIKAPASAWSIPPLHPVTDDTKEDRGKRRLFRSESFRAFRGDRKRNASPEVYIVKSEMAISPDKADGEESVTDTVLGPGVGGGVTDGQSFRSECLTLTKYKEDDAWPPSPRLLFRSFSAPEPGFSFSFKQHEASDSEPASVRMPGKSVVSAGNSSFIRGTVSSLRRHGFSSRRDLMMCRRKKTHWSSSNNNNKTSARAGEIHPAKMEEVPICAATPPSQQTFNLFKLAQANLSELPPSPVSPWEVAAGHSSRHFFTDLHFTLPPELSPKCVSEFEAPVTGTASESSFRTDISAVEAACSRDKAYITELLIAAGLYDDGDGLSSANARLDSMARPMPIFDDVFEDVEDMYYYRGDYIVGGSMYDDASAGGATAATDHKMLFDLANKALQSLLVVESSRAGLSSPSSLRRWVVESTGVSRGKKLVDQVWQQVQALRNPPEAQKMQTTGGMVVYEVRRSVSAELLLYEDVYVGGSKIERAIFDELIEGLVACAGGFHMHDCTSL